MESVCARPFIRNDVRLEQLGITPRELNILEAMAAGLSNREIVEQLFVSENTVKTHAARLFEKLSPNAELGLFNAPKRPGSSPERMIFGVLL